MSFLDWTIISTDCIVSTFVISSRVIYDVITTTKKELLLGFTNYVANICHENVQVRFRNSFKGTTCIEGIFFYTASSILKNRFTFCNLNILNYFSWRQIYYQILCKFLKAFAKNIKILQLVYVLVTSGFQNRLREFQK